MGSPETERYRVGYALEAKKVKTFILPSLLEQAEAKGLDLVPVDPARPLSEQGPFRCIIHKLHDPSWARELLSFAGPVVDPPDRVELLHSRTTMLEAVSRLQVPFNIGVPRQRVSPYPSRDDGSGLRFPVIAKPLLADGGADSHDMILVLNPGGLRCLPGEPAPPLLLQEFVNHGGVLFKVYVVGRHVCCVTRPSLPDIPDSGNGDNSGKDSVLPFSRISNAASSNQTDDHHLPIGLAEQLAATLRAELGLRLFNFDLIRSSGGDKYYVIDINYFPGYAKMPDYERVFTDFLLDVIRDSDTN